MQQNKPLLEFPCSFEIKIMGINCTELILEVTAIVAAHCGDFNPDDDIKIKSSTKGTYLSITATVNAKSQEHLDSVYLALNQHKLVKFIL